MSIAASTQSVFRHRGMTTNSRRQLLLSVLLLLGLCALPAQAAPRSEQAILSGNDIHHPVFARHGMVSSQEAVATEIGVGILQSGGNAVDAAVAVGFALAVTLPRAGNLGGGGFMLVHMQDRQKTYALDYREKAPAAAHRDMFLAADGTVDKSKSRFSHASAGVPGTVAGLIDAHRRFGRLPLMDVMAPAIALAEDGLQVTGSLAEGLKSRQKRLKKWPATAAIFYNADGGFYEPGDVLIQRDLAQSLRAIAVSHGTEFYKGAIAAKIAAEMERAGGPMTRSDLANYRPVWREPVAGTYRGYDVRSMPPPSSGGIHLVQILNILNDFPISDWGAGAAKSLHVMAEAMRRAYADRAVHLGDPDFWTVPLRGLTSKKYAKTLASGIRMAAATASADIESGDPVAYESEETTHFSIVDSEGNAVSNTYTLNFSFGSGIVATGTGILLNNEMDDFSAKPGVPNAYGLIGGEANAVAADKRPLSSMTPTLLLEDGRVHLVTGSPGGSRIITTVMQIVSNVVDHKMNIAAATAAPRMHHQWLPDEIRVETGFSPDTLQRLRDLGHKVAEKSAMGSTQSILVTDEGLYGASDPRRPGALTAGY